MEFDKSKVFTAINADELKVGSKGYFADRKEILIEQVQSEKNSFCLTRIRDGEFPFGIKNGSLFRYFYLVEEPKEPTKRPCNRDELLAMLQQQGLPMLINKQNDVVYSFLYLQSEALLTVSSLDEKCYIRYSYEELCNDFTLLDRTELWVEE